LPSPPTLLPYTTLFRSYLDAILAAHRARVAEDGRTLEALIEAARGAPPARAFAEALTHGFCVIAEVKRRSPSKGAIDGDRPFRRDRKSTRLNSSHSQIS